MRITGGTGATLTGTFDFSHEASGAKGQFIVVGAFDPSTRRLAFAPGEWITRPTSYETAGMEGELSPSGSAYQGRITNPACGAFRLSLVR